MVEKPENKYNLLTVLGEDFIGQYDPVFTPPGLLENPGKEVSIEFTNVHSKEEFDFVIERILDRFNKFWRDNPISEEPVKYYVAVPKSSEFSERGKGGKIYFKMTIFSKREKFLLAEEN